jgi:hypothetical protein
MRLGRQGQLQATRMGRAGLVLQAGVLSSQAACGCGVRSLGGRP